MISLATVERLRNLIEKSVLNTDPPLSYDRTIEAIAVLGNACFRYHSNSSLGKTEDWICLGQDIVPIDAIIIGSYWHLTEYHSGQFSNEYIALCSLSRIYSPIMCTGCEPESCEELVYNALNDLAEDN